MRLVHEKCGSLEQGAKENQMIVVRITNGLGNQMYQYALLLSLKKIYKDMAILNLFVPASSARPYPLFCLASFISEIPKSGKC